MALIQIYVARWCSVCAHSRHLFAAICEQYPHIAVELIDVAAIVEEDLSEIVFATPTWLCNEKRYCLGNPEPAALWQRLAERNAQQHTSN